VDRVVTASEAERAFAAAWWVVDDLVRFGMEQATVSPGSRSTPLALALARHPSVRVHVHLDERAAGFFALGIAKATGRPVAVACTSGTAAAELLPAVVEASMARATLVLLTADRPPELRGVGANQTIDQVGLFGGYVRASIDASVPGDVPDEQTWHDVVLELTRASMGLPPGPVHLNLPFREPLVGAPQALPASPPSGTDFTLSADPEPEEIGALEGELTSTTEGLILAGSMREPLPTLPELARRAGWPLLAEPTSNLRVPGALSAGSFLLADARFVEEHVPEIVVQFGAAPTSRAGLELARTAGRLVIVDQDHVVADPHRRAAWTLRAEPAGFVPDLLTASEPADENAWLRAWRGADEVARTAVDTLVDGWDEPFEGRIARDIAASVPDGGVLVVGSSMPVRDLDAYMAPRRGIGVLANRGASGIDGFVSPALGVSAAGLSTTALCGDLSLLHDVGSLLWSAGRGHDCVFVIPNNDGGAIFSFLPQRDLPEFEELFATPHGLELGAICRAARAGHTLVERAADLIPAIERAREAGGVHVLELSIDRARNVELHAAVQEAVATALAQPTM
jgi:2-succinyl-5-enolpyruvyl-6-hydroxy-3-cyclohexene-1-carboxylate synthase